MTALAPPTVDQFHPAVAAWFARRFPDGPTPPQVAAWPHIAAGSDVLVASPTGTGKTLTGFLVAIDAAYRAHDAGELVAGRTRVVYVSPLKALAVDIHQNLEGPLAEIAEEARCLGLAVPPITVAVRTGDIGKNPKKVGHAIRRRRLQRFHRWREPPAQRLR